VKIQPAAAFASPPSPIEALADLQLQGKPIRRLSSPLASPPRRAAHGAKEKQRSSLLLGFVQVEKKSYPAPAGGLSAAGHASASCNLPGWMEV
jgi:hypothetical protein